MSKGYLTVVPKEIRNESKINEGDFLEWSIEGDRIIVRPRARRSSDDVVGLISHGGDSVASKRRQQRGQRDSR